MGRERERERERFLDRSSPSSRSALCDSLFPSSSRPPLFVFLLPLLPKQRTCRPPSASTPAARRPRPRRPAARPPGPQSPRLLGLFWPPRLARRQLAPPSLPRASARRASPPGPSSPGEFPAHSCSVTRKGVFACSNMEERGEEREKAKESKKSFIGHRP